MGMNNELMGPPQITEETNSNPHSTHSQEHQDINNQKNAEEV